MYAIDFEYDGKCLSDFGMMLCTFDSSSGLSVTGKITATSGTIGGFNIGQSYLANNTTSLCGNDNSIYVGTNGISCGKNIKILPSGILEAKYTEVHSESAKETFRSEISSKGLSVVLENSTDGLILMETNIGYSGIRMRPTENVLSHSFDLGYNGITFDYGQSGKSASKFFVGMGLFANQPMIHYNGTVPIETTKCKFLDTVEFNSNITVNSSITSNGNINNYTPANVDAYLNMKWADGKTHAILTRGNNGLDTYIGWNGNTDHKSALYLRGNTVKLKNSSGAAVLSDERLKNSFKSLDEFDEVFMELKPYAFKYNNGTSDRFHFGYKAQDIQETLLKNGFTTKDFGGFVQMSDNPDNEDYCGVTDPMGLIYTEFTSWNTHMIQKLYKENEELKQRITVLEQAVN